MGHLLADHTARTDRRARGRRRGSEARLRGHADHEEDRRRRDRGGTPRLTPLPPPLVLAGPCPRARPEGRPGDPPHGGAAPLDARVKPGHDRWRERSLPVQILVEIPPYGLRFLDQRDLPPARPVLEVPLTLDRVAHVRMLLVPDGHPHPVPPREPVRPAVPMLPRTAPKIAGDADIERAVPPVRHHVGEVGRHGLSLRRRCNAPILSPSPRHRTWMPGSSPA